MSTGASEETGGVLLDPTVRPRVLLIDDNKGFAELIQRWLGPRYEFSIAADGRTGIAAAERLLPKVVLLDIMMPGMSGIEVLRAFQGNPSLCRTPVVVVTAYAEMPEMAELAAYRPWVVLQKPFSPKILIECIDAILTSAEPSPPGGEEEEEEEALRQALAQELGWHFEGADLELVESIDPRYPPPPKVHGCSPDVVGYDRQRELLNLGIVETGNSLRGPMARLRIRELCEQMMAEGPSAGTRLPLSIFVPRGLSTEASRLLESMGLSSRLLHDIFVIEGEGGQD